MKRFTAAAFGLMLIVERGAAPARRRAPGCRRMAAPRSASAIAAASCAARVVWLHEPIDRRTGKPKTDKRNPDPAKRARPLIGLQVVNGLAPSGPNKWSGLIYNADDGRTYRASFKVQSESTAKVEGCVLMVLCKAKTWTRATDDCRPAAGTHTPQHSPPHPEEHRDAMRLEGWGGHMVRDALLRSAPHLRPGQAGVWVPAFAGTTAEISSPSPAGRTAPPALWDPSCRCPGAARGRASCRA